MRDHAYKPPFWPKTSPGDQKMGQKCLAIFVHRPSGRKSLGKIPNPKNRFKKIFLLFVATRAWSSNLSAAEFPHYNSDQNLLHKYVISMRPNRRGPNLTSRHFLETRKCIKPDKVFIKLISRTLTFYCVLAQALYNTCVRYWLLFRLNDFLSMTWYLDVSLLIAAISWASSNHQVTSNWIIVAI